MKAISLTQPWASLVAIGAKKIETRSWRTHHCGLLAIHASAGFPVDCRDLCAEDPFYAALAAAYGAPGEHPCYRELTGRLPRGAVVAVVRLIGCAPTALLRPAEPEATFGDFSPGRFAWILQLVERIEPPIPAKGLWEWGLWEWRRA